MGVSKQTRITSEILRKYITSSLAHSNFSVSVKPLMWLSSSSEERSIGPICSLVLFFELDGPGRELEPDAPDKGVVFPFVGGTGDVSRLGWGIISRA